MKGALAATIVLAILVSFLIFLLPAVVRLADRSTLYTTEIRSGYDRMVQTRCLLPKGMEIEAPVLRELNDTLRTKELRSSIPDLYRADGRKAIDHFLEYYQQEESGSNAVVLLLAYNSADLSEALAKEHLSAIMRSSHAVFSENFPQFPLEPEQRVSVSSAQIGISFRDLAGPILRFLLFFPIGYGAVVFLLKKKVPLSRLIRTGIICFTVTLVLVLADVLFVDLEVHKPVRFVRYEQSWKHFRIEQRFTVERVEDAGIGERYVWFAYPQTLEFFLKFRGLSSQARRLSYGWSSPAFECLDSGEHYTFAMNLDKKNLNIEGTVTEKQLPDTTVRTVIPKAHLSRVHRYLSNEQKRTMLAAFAGGYALFTDYCDSSGYVLATVGESRFINNHPNPPMFDCWKTALAAAAALAMIFALLAALRSSRRNS